MIAPGIVSLHIRQKVSTRESHFENNNKFKARLKSGRDNHAVWATLVSLVLSDKQYAEGDFDCHSAALTKPEAKENMIADKAGINLSTYC